MLDSAAATERWKSITVVSLTTTLTDFAVFSENPEAVTVTE